MGSRQRLQDLRQKQREEAPESLWPLRQERGEPLKLPQLRWKPLRAGGGSHSFSNKGENSSGPWCFHSNKSLKSYSPEDQGPAVLHLHEVGNRGNGLPVLQQERWRLDRRRQARVLERGPGSPSACVSRQGDGGHSFSRLSSVPLENRKPLPLHTNTELAHYRTQNESWRDSGPSSLLSPVQAELRPKASMEMRILLIFKRL